MFKIYKVYKQSLAYELKSMGNEIIDKEINTRNNKYYTYIFQDTEKLRECLTAISHNE